MRPWDPLAAVCLVWNHDKHSLPHERHATSRVGHLPPLAHWPTWATVRREAEIRSYEPRPTLRERVVPMMLTGLIAAIVAKPTGL